MLLNSASDLVTDSSTAEDKLTEVIFIPDVHGYSAECSTTETVGDLDFGTLAHHLKDLQLNVSVSNERDHTAGYRNRELEVKRRIGKGHSAKESSSSVKSNLGSVGPATNQSQSPIRRVTQLPKFKEVGGTCLLSWI
jgi:hypothetical protein